MIPSLFENNSSAAINIFAVATSCCCGILPPPPENQIIIEILNVMCLQQRNHFGGRSEPRSEPFVGQARNWRLKQHPPENIFFMVQYFDLIRVY